jgi:hypothetical protein
MLLNPKPEDQSLAESTDQVRQPKVPLSLTTRVLLHTVGWILVAVGIAGLVLPGIQGVLTGVLGLALISVASQTVHSWLRERFRRWPKAWRRMERFRRRVERRLRPKH